MKGNFGRDIRSHTESWNWNFYLITPKEKLHCSTSVSRRMWLWVSVLAFSFFWVSARINICVCVCAFEWSFSGHCITTALIYVRNGMAMALHCDAQHVPNKTISMELNLRPKVRQAEGSDEHTARCKTSRNRKRKLRMKLGQCGL